MSFDSLYYLLLPLILLPLYLIFIRYSSNRYETLKHFTIKGIYESNDIARSIRNGRKNFVMFSLVIILLSIALAKPNFGNSFHNFQTDETILLIDASSSMNATDIGKSRLEVAKQIANDIVMNSSEQLSLAAFAEDCYFFEFATKDKASLINSIADIRPENFSHQGSNLDVALSKSVFHFSNQNENRKRIVLISDGEFHSEASDSTKELLVNKGITVDCFIIGTSKGADILTSSGRKVRTRAIISQGKQITNLSKGSLVEIKNSDAISKLKYSNSKQVQSDNMFVFSLENAFILLAIAILLLIWKF